MCIKQNPGRLTVILVCICYLLISTSLINCCSTFFNMRNTKVTKSPKFPCGTCSDECHNIACIECTRCRKWIHRDCVPMDEKEFKKWGNWDMTFVCRNCAFSRNKKYDFTAAMTRIMIRIGNTLGAKRLITSAGSSELALLKLYAIQLPKRQEVTGREDKAASGVLRLFHPIMLQSHLPLSVQGDGNCLYRAISRGLYGNEDAHLHIRLLAAIEIATHRLYYDSEGKSYIDIVMDNRLWHDPYNRLLAGVCQPGTYSEPIAIFAASAALSVPIHSYCPPNSDDGSLDPLTRMVQGRGVRRTQGPAVRLMWTTTFVPKNTTAFRPNHFVVFQDKRPTSSVDLTTSPEIPLPNMAPSSPSYPEDFPPLSPLLLSEETPSKETPVKKSHSTKRKLSLDETIEFSPRDVKGSHTSTPLRSDSNRSVLSMDCDQEMNTVTPSSFRSSPLSEHQLKLSLSLSPASLNMDQEHGAIDSNDLSGSPADFTAEQAHDIDLNKLPASPSVDDETIPEAEGGYNLPAGPKASNAFLGVSEVLLLLTKEDATYLQHPYVPRGRKENKYFLVRNGENLERRTNGKASQFWDDCGSWRTGGASSITRYLQLPGAKLQKVVLKESVYCLERTRQKKTVFIPVDPQPSEDDVLKVHRRYAKHTLSAGYEKRVSWIEGVNSTLACYEYRGKFPGRIPHGKSIRQGDYMRLKPNMLDSIKEQTRTLMPREVYNGCDPVDGPRNLKQVRDAKYRDSKKLDPHAGCVTFADQVAKLEELQQVNPFIRLILRRPDKIPCVIIYTDEQMADLKRFCCSGPNSSSTVLCVDKTFNLSDLHVTTTTIKYLAVRRRNTGEHPLIAGPMFLHGNSDTETYFLFFQHINGVLGDCASQPILGSDDEKAIRAAFRHAFPDAPRIACTRHLKNNANDSLKDKIGTSLHDRQTILRKIFGSDGIVSAEDELELNYKIDCANETIEELAPTFQSYFEGRLVPLLRENFLACNKANFDLNLSWTNNNAESLHHVLKQAVHWKSRKLPVLVEKLQEVILGQYNEIKRSLIGLGDFKLETAFSDFARNQDLWFKLSAERRNQHFWRFLKKVKENKKVTRTVDGVRSVPTPTHGGKKPAQRRRKISERTVTTTKKA